MSCALTLGKLIEVLKRADPKKVVPRGFGKAMSWRGIYEELSFEPAENVTVEAMLQSAEEALGKTFQGYKGGDYTMRESTGVHISYYGESYDYLGEWLLLYMLGDPVSKECQDCKRMISVLLTGHSRVTCLEYQLEDAKMAETGELAEKAKNA